MRNHERKTHIFVLDDDRYYGLFLQNALRAEGYDVRYFQHEYECIEQLKLLPEVLILDHKLETLTGLDVLDEVKRQCKGKTQVIYLSAQEHGHIVIKALKEGATTYLEKDEGVVSAVKEAISRMVKLTNNFNESLDLKAYRNYSLPSFGPLYPKNQLLAML